MLPRRWRLLIKYLVIARWIRVDLLPKKMMIDDLNNMDWQYFQRTRLHVRFLLCSTALVIFSCIRGSWFPPPSSVLELKDWIPSLLRFCCSINLGGLERRQSSRICLVSSGVPQTVQLGSVANPNLERWAFKRE